MDEILFYLANVEGDADVRDMRHLVQALQASHGWADILEFVDVVEDAGMTRPEDKPVRTLGARLRLPGPSNAAADDSFFLRNARGLMDGLKDWTSGNGREIEVLFNGEYIGDVKDGVVDDIILEGLLL